MRDRRWALVVVVVLALIGLLIGLLAGHIFSRTVTVTVTVTTTSTLTSPAVSATGAMPSACAPRVRAVGREAHRSVIVSRQNNRDGGLFQPHLLLGCLG
jgi:hypothetical protein